MSPKSVYDIRNIGKEFCNNTTGSDHYKQNGVEPIDLMISNGSIEGFCIGSIIKYATRFKVTENLNDLKKISDYAHILCGVKLTEPKKEE